MAYNKRSYLKSYSVIFSKLAANKAIFLHLKYTVFAPIFSNVQLLFK